MYVCLIPWLDHDASFAQQCGALGPCALCCARFGCGCVLDLCQQLRNSNEPACRDRASSATQLGWGEPLCANPSPPCKENPLGTHLGLKSLNWVLAPEMTSAFLTVSCLELVAGSQSPTGSCLCGISAEAVFAALQPKLGVTGISCSDDAVTAACHFRDLCGAELSDKHLPGLGILLAVLAPSEKPQVCPHSTDCFLLASISLCWCPCSSLGPCCHIARWYGAGKQCLRLPPSVFFPWWSTSTVACTVWVFTSWLWVGTCSPSGWVWAWSLTSRSCVTHLRHWIILFSSLYQGS